MLDGAGDFRRRVGVRTERHAAVPHVRAGDVDFENFNLFFLRQQLDTVNVFLHRKTADVGDNRLMEDFSQCGQFVRDDVLHAGILQADGVQHPVRAFRNARRWVAEAAFRRCALEGQAA